jgi:hypothetical protein
MSLPRRKNNINVYPDRTLMDRRYQLLDMITEADTFLPDSVLHDDLDLGMVEFIKNNFIVISDGQQIPIIGKILTIQRWGEIANKWQYSDEENNIKLPFIAIIRQPDPQPGTHPITIRTIPERKTFYYSGVKTWDGTQEGMDIYKIPQPVPVDISYDVVIVCQKMRDLNRFNKIVLQRFASRQAYTVIKGHYIPIIFEKNTDVSPLENLDQRRFYVQTYSFILLGLLIDAEEFEIKPAVNRVLLMTEFMEEANVKKVVYTKSIDVISVNFVANGSQTMYSVGQIIGYLFYVAVNGQLQERDNDYYWIGGTSRIVFEEPPINGSDIEVVFTPEKTTEFISDSGVIVYLETQYFTYSGGTPIFTTHNIIDSIIYVEINGLVDIQGLGYTISGLNTITFIDAPIIGSVIGICYFYQ